MYMYIGCSVLGDYPKTTHAAIQVTYMYDGLHNQKFEGAKISSVEKKFLLNKLFKFKNLYHVN